MSVEERKLLTDSKDHDRRTCNCDGCKLYWTGGTSIKRIGPNRYVIMEMAPFGETIKDFHRDFIILQRTLALCPKRVKEPPHMVYFRHKRAIIWRQL